MLRFDGLDGPLRRVPAGLEPSEHVVVRVVRLEGHP
jgi:hypothetical protein